MTDRHHRDLREALPLAAAGGLGAEEERRARAHLATCSSCSGELFELQGLASKIRALPTPRPPEGLVERVRRVVHLELAGRSDERLHRMVLAFLLLFSWTVTLVSFLAARIVAGAGAGALGLVTGGSLLGSVAYFTAAWLGGALSLVVIGLHHRKSRRLA